MGDGTKEHPYTREDILRLIKENDGNTEGLNLVAKYFELGIKLNQTELNGISLNTCELIGANLKLTPLHNSSFIQSNLSDANFINASIGNANFQEAELFSADFSGASIDKCNFTNSTMINANFTNTSFRNSCCDRANMMGVQFINTIMINTCFYGANLNYARFKHPRLSYCQFDNKTVFDNVDWGDYVVGEEYYKETTLSTRIFSLSMAESIYRRLKIWYTEHGIYDVAGKFFYREMEARRKSQSWKNHPLSKMWSWIMRMLCGYGEKPERVVISAAALILLLSLIYFGLSSWSAFGHSLYFSAVSFTAVGYGSWIENSWIDISNNWIKGIGVAESFLGVFMMALFLVTFTRKMTR